MDRTILHSDLNSCYASIECSRRTDLRGKPVAVGGDTEKRHGIILAANPTAKKFGVKTGNAIWEAVQKCPGLVTLPPNMPLYIDYSQRVKHIYDDYTPQQEPFGLDESWLDVTGSPLGSGVEIADEIRRRVKRTLGITVSVGVSYNKIFAKLGSDMKKSDAVTTITRENYRDIVWPLPVGDLLYVGPATQQKLSRVGIRTIGQLAEANPDFLHQRLGKMGHVLSAFANGLDASPVMYRDDQAPIKSIGNSTTTPRDMTCDEDVYIVFLALTESVTARLREAGFMARGVQISVRDTGLARFERQCKLRVPTTITEEILQTGMTLFRQNWKWQKPLRSIGIRATDLVPANQNIQLSLFDDDERRRKMEALEHVMDKCRSRYGYHSIRRGITMTDDALGGLDAKGEHTVHPVSYFG